MAASDASRGINQAAVRGPGAPNGAGTGVSDQAMLAHDIRGALQGVIGGIIQVDAARLDPDLREQVERITAAAKTLDCLIRAALGDEPDFGERSTHARVDLRRFMRHLQRRWSGEARAQGLRFDVEAAGDIPFGLNVEFIPLARILGNLIGNAIRYTETGSVRVGLRRESAGGVAFRVRDDGPGLSDAALDMVFGHGYRPRIGAHEQHGLGLHIVKGLSEEIGGAVEIANRAAGGVEAVLRFPAALSIATDQAASDGGGASRARPDLDGLRILLAEDNLTNQLVAIQMLRALNAEVTVASDGVEALEAFESAAFDLVVVDIEMPRMSGLDVIRAIRARGDARARVPIVALTAYALREHRDRIATVGADGLISKPIASVDALGRALLAHVAPRPSQETVAPRPAANGAEPPATAGSAAAAGHPMVDLGVYDALCAAIGAEMMAELLEKVVDDLTTARADLAGALSPLDRGPIRSASHILISVAGAVGAMRLHNRARALNLAAHADAAGDIAPEVQLCLDEIDAAVGFARNQRAKS